MRALDGHPSPPEITGIAFRYIPGLGQPDTHIVERIWDEFADEHALARADRWLDDREKPPTIAIPDARTRPDDDGSVVPPDTVRATVAYHLGARSSRSCLDPDPDSVIGCAGPDEPGYCCPACCQQGRREDAIIDALLAAWADDTAPRPRDSTDAIDASDRDPPSDTARTTQGTARSEVDSETETTVTAHSSDMSRETTTDTTDDAVSTDQTTAESEAQTDCLHGDGQMALDTFAGDNRGENV